MAQVGVLVLCNTLFVYCGLSLSSVDVGHLAEPHKLGLRLFHVCMIIYVGASAALCEIVDKNFVLKLTL